MGIDWERERDILTGIDWEREREEYLMGIDWERERDVLTGIEWEERNGYLMRYAHYRKLPPVPR